MDGSPEGAGPARPSPLPDAGGPGLVPLGMVHGRFQPFHVGHLEYLRSAAARSRRIVVGITNPDRTHLVAEEASPHRSLPSANPFTYAERAEMLHAVLRDERLVDALVVPFPISEPARWPEYVPSGVVHFLRVFDRWGEEKVARLRAAGHAVVVLDAPEGKTVTGTEVRRRLRAGGAWAELVPPAVADVIRSLQEDRALDLRRPA